MVEEQAARPVPDTVRALGDALVARGGESVLAVLFYGSWLRHDDAQGVADLYVLVDSYRAYYRRPLAAAANRVLAPNVFYLELRNAGGVTRAKYAVISLHDFACGVSPKWFHSYLWGRFCQPVRLLYARDTRARQEVHRALSSAVRTFIARVLPCAPETFDARELWQAGFALSYSAELRAEGVEARAQALYDADPVYYERVTGMIGTMTRYAVEHLGAEGEEPRYRAFIPRHVRVASRVSWGVRRAQGKALSLARLIKAGFTFDGGLDYLAWKIQRHSGVELVVTPRMRRHPLLAGLAAAWRAYRRGGFR